MEVEESICVSTNPPTVKRRKQNENDFYIYLIIFIGVFCPTDPVRLRRKDDGYNVAMTGSTSEALPLQLTEITKRVEEDKDSGVFPPSGRILFTLLIGSNDLCMWDCRRPETQLNSFRTHVTQFIGDILGYFGEERIDVLVAEIPALEGVPVRANGTVMEPFAVLECPCSYRNNPTYSFASRIELYNQVLRSIPSIKLTDALRREKLKDWPPEMTSKLDAFHPSKWAHGYFGKMIFDDHVKEVA